MQKYLVDLLEWYCDELGGEAFFSALANDAGDAGQATKWRTLARLEHHVAGRLRIELTARGVEIPAGTAELQRGLDNARQYARLTWPVALVRLRDELVRYVRGFEAAESRMPEDVLELARFVTDHERALLEFVTRELDLDGERSLESVMRLLGEGTEGTEERQPI